MIKISVMYPYAPEARFDMEYYCNVHMPMVKSRMGDDCLGYEVDKGLAGGVPGSMPAYVAVAHIYCESLDSFRRGFGPHAAEFREDVKNYTDIASVLQISELAASTSVVGRT